MKVTAVSAGVKINTDWEGFKFYSYDKDGNLTLDSVYTKEQLDSLGINKGVIDLREEWLKSQGKDS